MRLTFLGGAGTVTGSKTVVDASGSRLLVDCGLFQGFKHLRLKNRAELPVPPASIGAVLLTHAHLDHSGWLPVLVRRGFRGPIVCTKATGDLLAILLLDAARIEEEQAAWLKAKKKSKHANPEPLFTTEDAERAIERVMVVSTDEQLEPVPRIRASFTPVGHILGACSVHVEADGARALFSGDVGRPHDPILLPPQVPPAADTLVLESTYGARRHEESDVRRSLADAVRATLERRGIVMIPAFAVGRAQAILHLLQTLTEEERIPRVPVLLNSPMALDVSVLLVRHRLEHRLSAEQCRSLAAFAQPVRTTEESKLLNQQSGPLIVVAGSGMMTGGRILHHLAAWAGDARNTILLVGHQAPGTRGATLLAGAKSLRLFGGEVKIRAEVKKIDVLSGHADADELLAWLRSFPWRPRQVLLNHGEPDQSDALRQRLERELGWKARVVLEHDVVDVLPEGR